MDRDGLFLLLRRALPDVEVLGFSDWSGTGDHLNVHLRSERFAGLSLLDQHRLVYAAVGDAMSDGRIHALQIKTEIREKV